MELTILDVKYSVNAKKKAVTCVINAFVEDEDFCISRVIPKKFRKLNPDMWENTTEIESVKYVKSVAVTRLADGDEFDEERGKVIAKKKCKIKLYKEIEKYIHIVLDVVYDKLVSDANKYVSELQEELWTFEKEDVGICLPEVVLFKCGTDYIKGFLHFDKFDGIEYKTEDGACLESKHCAREMRNVLDFYLQNNGVKLVEE